MTSRLLSCLLVLCAVCGSAHAQSSAAAGPTAEARGPADQPDAVPADGSTAAGDGTATPSEAEQEAARAHFRMGVDFYRERNFRAALIEFKRAYRAAPHYKLLYNLGQASVELQEYSSAIDYLSGYLRAGQDEIDEGRKKEVQQTILELEARIATVTIECEDGANISVDDESIGRTPLDRLVRVSAGRRRFSAERANGQRTERVLDVAAGDHLTVSLSFEERSDEAQANMEAVESAGGGTNASGGMSPVIPWAIATTAVLAAGTGTVAVLTALAEKDFDDERMRETTKTQLDSLRDDAKTKALVTDILLSATLASAIVTTVLILTDTGDAAASEHANNALHVAVGPGNIALRGTL
jgi:tetratricopeptide (TPR) repeat protein